VVEVLHDGFFFVDVWSDEILAVNESACSLLGYRRAELQSLAVSDVHPDEMDRLREFASTADSRQETFEGELHCLRKDGQTVPVEASACHVEYRDRRGTAIAVRDRTTAQQQNQYLRVMNRILRHNFRNKLNVILNRAEVLERQLTDEEQIDQCEQICRSVSDLVEAIEHIRVVQQSLQTDIDDARVDCSSALHRIVGTFERRYPRATVTTALPESLFVRADSRLCHALEQVIENAIVHNDLESPNVEIVARRVEQPDCARIQIIDDGPGIPDEEQFAVANPEQISPLDHGTGIGLWAVAMIVCSLDGTITIADDEPRGTVVTIDLPQLVDRSTR